MFTAVPSVSVTTAYGLSYNSKFEKWRDDERIRESYSQTRTARVSSHSPASCYKTVIKLQRPFQTVAALEY